jgi:hypothetical protein
MLYTITYTQTSYIYNKTMCIFFMKINTEKEIVSIYGDILAKNKITEIS